MMITSEVFILGSTLSHALMSRLMYVRAISHELQDLFLKRKLYLEHNKKISFIFI